jgi:TusE/DsrC/DsvC family sulfur relay protein
MAMHVNATPYRDADQRQYIDSLMDAGGFLREPHTWSTALATAIARLDGLPEMTAEHWRVIQALREHFERFGAAPPAFSHICARQHLGPHCVERLFRSDREAWRIAGLPDPGEEVKSYL